MRTFTDMVRLCRVFLFLFSPVELQKKSYIFVDLFDVSLLAQHYPNKIKTNKNASQMLQTKQKYFRPLEGVNVLLMLGG